MTQIQTQVNRVFFKNKACFELALASAVCSGYGNSTRYRPLGLLTELLMNSGDAQADKQRLVITANSLHDFVLNHPDYGIYESGLHSSAMALNPDLLFEKHSGLDIDTTLSALRDNADKLIYLFGQSSDSVKGLMMFLANRYTFDGRIDTSLQLDVLRLSDVQLSLFRTGKPFARYCEHLDPSKISEADEQPKVSRRDIYDDLVVLARHGVITLEDEDYSQDYRKLYIQFDKSALEALIFINFFGLNSEDTLVFLQSLKCGLVNAYECMSQ